MASIVEEGVGGEGAEAALPVTVPVPAWLEDAGRLMNGVGLDSGGLLTGVRNLMVSHHTTYSVHMKSAAVQIK
jgi:hypothetical protein